MATRNVLELLRKNGLLDERQHDTVLIRARTSSGGVAVQRIAEMGFATEAAVGRSLSVALGLTRIDLGLTPPEANAISLLDGQTCADRFVLPIALRENNELLWLAMGDPTDAAAMALVRKKTGKRVRPVVATPSEISREVRRIYGTADRRDEPMFEADPASAAFDDEGVEIEESFEIVNVSDASSLPTPAASVPPPPPAHSLSPGLTSPGMPSLSALGLAGAALRPQPAVQSPPLSTQADFDALFAVRPRAPQGLRNDLRPEEVLNIEAVRLSMEKAELVLRAVGELCIDERLFSEGELGKKTR